MSLPPHSELEKVDVEWLRILPRHWTTKRLKRISDVFASNVDKKSYEGESSVRLCNYTDVYYNDRITSELPFMSATASPDQIERFRLRAGDTIITKDSETADDIAIPAFVPNDLPDVICGYHLSIVRPKADTDGAYIKWLFDSQFIKASVQVRANGLTRVGLGQYALDNLTVPVPPLPEQTAIAAFLDRETSKIDGLVEEQRQLIALLREKRQAVISHAVTKGLNLDAPMKDSGVEWLGEVPAHWTVSRLKHLSSHVVDCLHTTPTYDGDLEFPAVRTADVERGRLLLDQTSKSPLLVPNPSAKTILAATWSDDEGCYVLSVGVRTRKPPPAPTWREFLTRRAEPITPEEIDDNWGLTLDKLDKPVDPYVWGESWLDFGTSESKAYDLLEDLDLGPTVRAKGRPHVLFQSGGVPGATGSWVTVPDDLSLSFLQARLVDLKTGVTLVA